MTRFVRLGAVSLSLVALVACGGSSDDAGSEGTGSGSASQPDDMGAGAPAGSSTFAIKATEALVFEPASLSAKVGEKVEGTLTQVGSVPHNIEFQDFGVKPEDTMVLKDGESKSFSFTPDKAGDFTYVCTIHPSTMKGTLTVS
ncbi:MAG TPA: cupredoxin domain-containing protein [Mycobacteriales bacterium]|nr:cupredoxin domain-containing protein [Mycobacteriales bacterium]